MNIYDLKEKREMIINLLESSSNELLETNGDSVKKIIFTQLSKGLGNNSDKKILSLLIDGVIKGRVVKVENPIDDFKDIDDVMFNFGTILDKNKVDYSAFENKFIAARNNAIKEKILALLDEKLNSLKDHLNYYDNETNGKVIMVNYGDIYDENGKKGDKKEYSVEADDSIIMISRAVFDMGCKPDDVRYIDSETFSIDFEEYGYIFSKSLNEELFSSLSGIDKKID